MQRVLVDSTESVVSYPRLSADSIASGVPSSVTARRITPIAQDEDFATASPTVDSLSATSSDEAREGDTSISLTASAAIVAGRRYLITDAETGARVEVVPSRGGSLTTMYLQEPLPCDVALGSTIQGMALICPLSASQTVNPGSGYVLFRATVDGVVRQWEESFRIVRRITSIALTVNDLTQTYPVVRKLASSTDTTLEESIQAAWRSQILPWLAASSILDEDILTDDVLLPVHATAVVLHLARQWPATTPEFYERLENRYEQEKATALSRVDLAMRSQEEINPTPAQPKHEPRKSMRIGR